MKAIHAIAFILLVIGGLNWGLIGINSNWNLVWMIFGSWPTLVSIIYILVGLSAIYLVVTHKKTCKCCDKSASSQPTM